MVTRVLISFVFYVIIALFMGFTMYSLLQPGIHEYRVIDCRLSEISPDFSTDMREQCRKLRMEQVK